MFGVQQHLPIFDVELDRNNPRIRRFVEGFEGELTDDNIQLALDIGGDDGDTSKGVSGADKLRNSILANRGIMQPIIVCRNEAGRYLCIEGNTRLFIYRQFHENGVAGDWSTIPAIVHETLVGDGVDAIRLQAHLVGPRAWDAYSKAKYQWELQIKHLMPLDRLVELCGGDRRDVQKSINAYADMETHFRKLHQPGEFYNTQRYSGFVELQNTKVKTAIFRAGFSLDDFAVWLKEKKIDGLIAIRQLPLVLGDKNARAIFLKKDIKAALDAIERPDIGADLRAASLSQLARAITEKAEKIPFIEIQRLRQNPDDDVARYVLDALDALQNLAGEFQQRRDDVG
ncbi:hypothetical protein FHT86_003537 [Rhizobium sp. BK313]|uniref:ParB N-terminal domain-containing protein n=1 Tax=Rhizobium sp. BK313 TaxID=2587081 RepID=UPI00105C42E4|nr:ParB N-terminal domain-containing protein [Rhizobium sp. BK313]MBB3455238.1 hypothetical protein [Rhizobium sp. BK313]